MCDHGGVEINCWVRLGEKTTFKAPTPKPKAVTALRAAIKEVCATDSGDASVVFEVPSPVSAWLRSTARLVLGVGSVMITTLLLALFVVDTDMRGTLLLAVVAVAGSGGMFVTVVWQLDVVITLHGNGRLVRKGWNGFTEVDLRNYHRVTIKVDRGNGVGESDLYVN